MYNILIVDDEPWARSKIKFMVDYEKFGFCIIGEAANGKEAIDFINTHPVNVVFTDVSMPEIDGIELTQYINSNTSHIKVVIMSNYSDFEYVKKVFSANAVDYILKNELNADTVRNILNTLSKTLTGCAVQNSFSDTLNKESNYRTKIIHALTEGDPAFCPVNSIVLALKIDNENVLMPVYTNDEIDIIYKNIYDIIAQAIKNERHFVTFRIDAAVVLYLPFSDNMREVDIMHQINRYIQQITSSVHKFFNFKLLWGISCPSSKDVSLQQCCSDAITMLENNFFSGKTTPYPALMNDSAALSIQQEKQLLSVLFDLNTDKLSACLDEIFAEHTPKSSSDLLVCDLISLAVKFCSDLNIAFPEITDFASTGETCTEWCKNIFKQIVTSYIETKNIQQLSQYVQSAISFIQKNYSENISLKDISKHIGLSEQHLSTVFKEETGKNLFAFLNEYRIERAKSLLEQNNINLKHLYSMVGFNSYNYFFTVFKKYVGCTPETYRKKFIK